MKARNSKKFFGRDDCDLRRRGVAAAELAVCLPVIVLLVLAMIESCTMIFLKQSLTVAAYEGIRTSLEERAVEADVRAACQQVLTDRSVQGGTINVDPVNFERLAPGEYISVTITAPADPNSVIPGSFYRGKTLSATATMMKEL
ncbi:MAG: pilus assembly protein [Planctomycetales bacterium]|nr:pilus assembly protein [Planctomycetales bacterium]